MLKTWKKNLSSYSQEYENMENDWKASNEKKKEAWAEQSRRSPQPEIEDDWGTVPVFISSQVNGAAERTAEQNDDVPMVETVSPSRRLKVERQISSADGRARFKALADITEATQPNGKKQNDSSKKKRKIVESPEEAVRKKRKAIDGSASNTTPESSAQASNSRPRPSKETSAPEQTEPEEYELPPLRASPDEADEQLNQQQAIARSALAAERLASPEKEVGENQADENQTEENQADAATTSRRSTRKKARPAYTEDGNGEGEDAELENDLPSPSAITPKRRRAQPASRKRAPARQRQKRQESVDGEENEPQWGYRDGSDVDETVATTTKWKQGKFSEHEYAQLASALESYRVSIGVDQQQLNTMIHAPGGASAGEQHKAMWARVIEAIPGRHRQKIINITRKRYHNFVARGTWTEEQDMELGELINTHGTKWSLIGSLVNRHPEDLRDRYRNYLICGNNQIRQAWTEEEEAELTKYIIASQKTIDAYRSMDESFGHGKTYEELIDWKEISAHMGLRRSRLQCLTKWKSMHLRTHPSDVVVSAEPDATISFRLESARRQIENMPDEEKFRFVLAVDSTLVLTDDRIPWGRLVDAEFRSKWHRPTLALLWERLRQSVPFTDGRKQTTRDCASYLRHHYNENHRFPNVVGTSWDDEEENELIKKVAYVGSSVRPSARPVSDEKVADSDEEKDEVPETTAMEIDPALEDESEEATALAATPAKRTSMGKRPGGRRPQRPSEKAPSTPTKKPKRKSKGKAAAQPEDADSD